MFAGGFLEGGLGSYSHPQIEKHRWSRSLSRAVSWSRGRVLGSNPRRKQGGVLCCKRKGKWEGGLSHWMQPEVRGFRTRSPEVRPVEGTGLPCKGPKEGVQSASQLPTFHGAMESRTCKSSPCGSAG